jgi:hypothetical protein
LGGVSRQALDQRVERLKKRLPMTPDDAVAVIGHEQGVDISRWLDADSLARASGYVGQLKAQATASTKPALRPGASKPVYVNVGDGPDVDPLPGMTAAHAREARKMAREVYPLLYVFENSARDVIARVLTAAIGPDWWPRVVPSKVQERAAIRMTAEGQEAWHSRRGAAPIQYVDLEDLAKIVRDGRVWPHFKDLFPRANWFDSVIDDMNVSRRVVAHMNPLAGDDIKSVEQGFRKWRKQLQAKADLLA